MKTATISLILAAMLLPIAPAMGQDVLVAGGDTAYWNIGTVTSGAVWIDSPWSWGDDLLRKHDTTREYVSEIGDKCDTVFVEKWVFAERIKGEKYFRRMAVVDSVHCYVDSVWAKKQAVYLTPDEMKRLWRLLR